MNSVEREEWGPYGSVAATVKMSHCPTLPCPCLSLAQRAREREKQNSWPTQLPGFNSAYPLSPSRLKSERERAPSLLTYTHFFKKRTGKTTDIVDLYPFPSPFFPSLSRLKSERESKSQSLTRKDPLSAKLEISVWVQKGERRLTGRKRAARVWILI